MRLAGLICHMVSVYEYLDICTLSTGLAAPAAPHQQRRGLTSLLDFRQRFSGGVLQPVAAFTISSAALAVNVCRAQQDQQPTFMVQKIIGDGRCLFRSLAQGDHQLRHGAQLPIAQETSKADEIREQVHRVPLLQTWALP